jgi:hypothetical protein
VAAAISLRGALRLEGWSSWGQKAEVFKWETAVLNLLILANHPPLYSTVSFFLHPMSHLFLSLGAYIPSPDTVVSFP